MSLARAICPPKQQPAAPVCSFKGSLRTQRHTIARHGVLGLRGQAGQQAHALCAAADGGRACSAPASLAGSLQSVLAFAAHATGLAISYFGQAGALPPLCQPLPAVSSPHRPVEPAPRPLQACLSTKAKPGTKAALRVRVSEEGEPLLVCVLREGGTESIGLDLIFDQ